MRHTEHLVFTVWSLLTQGHVLNLPKVLEAFDIYVSSSAYGLLLVMTVEPRYYLIYLN